MRNVSERGSDATISMVGRPEKHYCNRKKIPGCCGSAAIKADRLGARSNPKLTLRFPWTKRSLCVKTTPHLNSRGNREEPGRNGGGTYQLLLGRPKALLKDCSGLGPRASGSTLAVTRRGRLMTRVAQLASIVFAIVAME